MNGKIIKDKKNNLFLQLETGQSYSMKSVAEILNNADIIENDPDFYDLMFVAYNKMKRNDIGLVYSENADDDDEFDNIDWSNI